jgi:hypothetical protein
MEIDGAPEMTRHEVVQARAKARGLRSIALRWNIGPRGLLIDERSDPVSVISSICRRHLPGRE